MTIRLLSKKEIDIAKAGDRAREITEGVKLAKRVDALRQIHADEEASLEQFRIKTITKIKEETEREEIKRNILANEVSRLEKRREEALKPLTKEKNALALESARIEEEKRLIAQARFHLSEAENELETALQNASLDQERALDMRKRAEKLLADAENTRIEAGIALQDSKKALNASLERARVMDAELRAREEFILARERDVEIKETRLQEEERLIRLEKIRLDDRAKTLERAFIRLK